MLETAATADDADDADDDDENNDEMQKWRRRWLEDKLARASR